MMKRIIVRETKKDYFIIYLMQGDIKVSADIATSVKEKKEMVNNLLLSDFADEMTHDEIYNDLVTEYSFIEIDNTILNNLSVIEKMEINYPLILVFYLDAEMMNVKEIIQPFTDSVNTMLAHKNANAMAFFLPTKGEERIEQISFSNEVVDMGNINKLVNDIKDSFTIK